MPNRRQRLIARRRSATERRYRLAQLQVAGVRNLRDLAAELDVSVATVSRDLDVLSAEFRDRSYAMVAAEKGVALARAEEVIRSLWPQRDRPRVAEVLLQWQRFIGDVLGYWAPTKHIELTDEFLDAEIRRLEREIEEEQVPIGSLPAARMGR